MHIFDLGLFACGLIKRPAEVNVKYITHQYPIPPENKERLNKGDLKSANVIGAE